jgi:hypothetical protein
MIRQPTPSATRHPPATVAVSTSAFLTQSRLGPARLKATYAMAFRCPSRTPLEQRRKHRRPCSRRHAPSLHHAGYVLNSAPSMGKWQVFSLFFGSPRMPDGLASSRLLEYSCPSARRRRQPVSPSQPRARSSTDRVADFESEGWRFESSRARLRRKALSSMHIWDLGLFLCPHSGPQDYCQTVS